MIDEPEAPSETPESTGRESSGESATILLADDEPTIRRLAKTFLERKGYRVLVASDGAEALDVFKNERVDLVVLDLSMPVLSGSEALRRIREERPDQRAVLISGYDATGALRTHQDERTGFIMKPFHAADLVQVVGEMLAE